MFLNHLLNFLALKYLSNYLLNFRLCNIMDIKNRFYLLGCFLNMFNFSLKFLFIWIFISIFNLGFENFFYFFEIQILNLIYYFSSFSALCFVNFSLDFIPFPVPDLKIVFCLLNFLVLGLEFLNYLLNFFFRKFQILKLFFYLLNCLLLNFLV